MKTPESTLLLLLSSLFSLFLILCHASSSLGEGRDGDRDTERDSHRDIGRDDDAQQGSTGAFTAAELVARFPRTLAIDPILGLVRRCSKCGEWWSATHEFFGSAPGKNPLGLHSQCHACTNERNRRRRQMAVTA